ncbi:hypothetical protein [Terrisporobacter mayombei]|nr:hypothetical protein [Terrisporobacter mayombei]
MSIAPSLNTFNTEHVSVIEAATKETFSNFKVNSVYSSSSSKYAYVNGGSSTSNIYPKTSKEHNMEGAIRIKESQAKSKGYGACKRR